MFETANKILNDADVIISEDRVKDYGDPKICFRTLSELWTSYTGHPITPNDVAMMMVLLKVVRNKHCVKLDNLVDICGYAALAGELTMANDTLCVPDKDNSTPHTSDWHPTPGELIEVSNIGATGTWVKAKFVEMEDQQYVCSVNLGVHLRLLWPYARKLQEPQKKAEDTQIDSGCDLQRGDLVAVRDSAYAAWSIRIFSHIEDHRYVCFKWSDTTNEGTGEIFAWRYCVPLYLCQPVISTLIGSNK